MHKSKEVYKHDQSVNHGQLQDREKQETISQGQLKCLKIS